MKGASNMKAKRWTLGVVLAAAVSLFGLIQADASPFSTHILSDDLGNMVNGKAPKDPAMYDNNGHGNNVDGVDSSNKGQGNGGPNGGVDESCPEGGVCVDDEAATGSKTKGKK
jgi:hypothetical protein